MSLKPKLVWLFWLALCVGLPAHAEDAGGGKPAAEVLRRLDQYGFADPMKEAAALEQFISATPRADPSMLPLRAALTGLYIAAGRRELVERELSWLQRASQDGSCALCRQWYDARRIQWLLRDNDMAKLIPEQARIKALAIAADPAVRHIGLYLAGAAAELQGDHTGTIEYGLKALRLAEQLKMPAEQVRALNLMIAANIALRNLPQAQAYAKEALALAESIGFVYMSAYIRVNQAWINSLLMKPEDELAALRSVEAITNRYPGLEQVALVNAINFSRYYLRNGQYEHARASAAAAAALAAKQNKQTPHGVALIALGRALMAQGRVAEGVRAVEQSVAMLQKAGGTRYLADALYTLAEAKEKNGDPDGALAALRALLKLKDEMHSRDREHALLAAQERYKVERKDREIERLSLENARAAAEMAASTAQRRLWALFALVLAVAALGMAYVIYRALGRNRVLQKSNAHLSSESTQDPLTGAYNRRYCETRLDQAESESGGNGVGLILLDVDHFKSINDNFGHPVGDQVLIHIANRLNALVRDSDAVVRWGGEEFLVIVEGTEPGQLQRMCVRILEAIAAEPVSVDETTIQATVSVGAAVLQPRQGQTWRDLFALIDGALYRAKREGRNRACFVVFTGGTEPQDVALRDIDAAERASLIEVLSIPNRTFTKPSGEHGVKLSRVS